MKKAVSFLIGVILAGTLPAYSQMLVSYNHRGAPQAKEIEAPVVTLKAALSELERQYRVSFIYRTDLVDTKVMMTSHRERNVEDALSNLLADKGLTYEKIQNNFYIILASRDRNARFLRKVSQIEKRGLPTAPEGEVAVPTELNVSRLERIGFSMLSAERQDIQVQGRVSDRSGQGIPGVSVVIKGTTRGTTTNGQGEYSLSAPNNATLVLSFVGYSSQEIPVNGRSTVNVTLQEDIRALSEVVVVGYGTQKRAAVTGAISSVTSKEVAELPVVNVQQAIQGRVPGVSVVSNGAPGESPVVRIRGIGSINYASNPLYVIDGFPTGDLNNFDTRDIETVDVLKDASAAAIYGSRAANGVIIITTKRGSTDGRMHVSYDGYVGTQSAWRTLDVLNTEEYIRYGTALRTNAGQALPARFNAMNDPIYPGATQTYAQTNTDWQDQLFRSAPMTQHNISLSGGNDRSRFYSSAGYFSQEGIMLGTSYRRGNFRINSDHKISKRFTFGQSLTISYDDKYNENNSGGRTQIKHMLHMTPYMPVEDPTRVGGYRGPDGSDGSDPQNPVRIAVQDRDNTQRLKFLGSAFLEVGITDWLKYRFTGGIDYVQARQYIFLPIYNESFNARNPAVVTDNRTTYTSPLFTNQLTFDRNFGQHHLNVVAVAERQSGTSIILNTSGQAASNTIRELTGLANQTAQGSREKYVLFSYLARANYDYANKYLLSASFRRDGSSRFAPGKKWGNFPSVSVGWRISEEAFMKNSPAVSELKVRASYGSMGFNEIGNYPWQVAVSQTTNAVLGGAVTQGTYFDRLGNTDLQWEVTKMGNIGIDLGLFNNSITLSAEAYDRKTDGLILNQPVAPSIGYSNSPIANVGSMRNRGFELQLGYNKTSGDFRFNASANLGLVRNKVLSLGPEISPILTGSNADYGGYDITRTEAGQPIQYFYGWKVAGIFQSDEEVKSAAKQDNAKPGDIRFVDIDGNGVIDAGDRTNLGNFIPDFTYGANFSANYLGFDLSLFLQGVQGNKIFNGTKVLRQGMLRLFNAGTEVLNAWTPTNTNTDVPRAVDGDPNRNSRTSDRFIEDGSYLRLKNLSIGYSIPADRLQSWTRSTLSRARIYVSGQNLLTFTKYTGYDPEIGSRYNQTLTNGIDYGQYPVARSFTVGIQIGF
ncbi:SusC/RagA family TonB-linked outer membrane protein [Larkinella soli]|uniref:SusC/RagA family TonB-linked outer membrane protein n=1 Tax=Larkinella soli TaxID=1770527 RepID=UPI000FFB3A14|nr:TonB-dependent receptor [Larkinella soli]